MGGDRWSLKLVPGRGLFNTNDLSVVVFQSVRPRCAVLAAALFILVDLDSERGRATPH
jgi:hypothetical protein